MELKSLTKKEKQLIAEFRLCKQADKDSIMQKITDPQNVIARMLRGRNVKM